MNKIYIIEYCAKCNLPVIKKNVCLRINKFIMLVPFREYDNIGSSFILSYFHFN